MFVDRVRIKVQGGKGGDGCMGFRREKYVPLGGPNGGDGGNGGSVILRADRSADSLAQLSHRKHLRAASGTGGQGSSCRGRDGEDTLVLVPPGTLVLDANEGFTLKDLASEGDEIVVARGGKGGYGNEHFKTAENRAPREVTKGEPGETRELLLELKLIADVGVIGKPNAGKSTLLARVSKARPEIADYPFTTKHPNLGLVDVDFDHSFVMADIPGLIENAHEGAGLGLEFLRHVERTRVLIHLVEPCPVDGSDPLDNYRIIRRELAEYDAPLAERPEIIAISKCELPGAEEARDQLAAHTGSPVLLLSAATGQGIDLLLRKTLGLLSAAKAEQAAKA